MKQQIFPASRAANEANIAKSVTRRINRVAVQVLAAFLIYFFPFPGCFLMSLSKCLQKTTTTKVLLYGLLYKRAKHIGTQG